MRRRLWIGATVAVAATLLTGCAGTDAAGQRSQTRPVSASGPARSPVATTRPGPTQRKTATAGPSDAATMVRSTKARGNVERVLTVEQVPKPRHTWTDGIYTCTYRTSEGTVMMSVQDAANVVTGQLYFQTMQRQFGKAYPIRGMAALGLPSFETASGDMVFFKDGKTLHVDATRIRPAAGGQQTRTGIAYALAASIVACWSD